ncbi:NAD(P)-dependent oxidoreductase [Pedobacter puniceum]|uniref:Hydroxyacid dehydrogenase n=1 Tax=Pedobacter puniceum TaxID=2666136 RepID=A0A7K0FPR1_9SPHI|nr:NAD(P)-dependent oxidoreductase [Pedobacter puniceum]MRX47240.1 hydroxyacid dehydrogenase [Pedobacter puniceum]
MRRPLISILNSSTFGKHFADHMSTLEAFADIKHITVPADIDGDALAEHLKDSDGIIASVTPKIPRTTLEKCKNLVLLVRHGIGCDNVDLEAATELGIMVSRVEGIIEKEAVAEYAISLLMAGSRKLVSGSRAVINSAWSTRAGMIGMEIKGKTIGIIGLGNIGSRSSEILAKGFGANVVASDPYIAKERFAQFGAKEVSLEELIKTSHAILFHCPLTDETKRMLGKAQFDSMQKDVVLVNTCRGELVDEDALYEALQTGKLGCYATDVVEGEPIDGNHRLTKLENTIITPHLGGYSWESLHGMGQTCVDDSVAVFQNNGVAGELANPEVLKTKRRVWASQ